MKVPDIQHDNIHMLVIIESTFHMVGICTVLHKQLSAVIPIGLVSMLVQMAVPSALVEMFGGAVSLLIINTDPHIPASCGLLP